MAYTTQQLEEIVSALQVRLGSSVAEVHFGDQTLRFHGPSDIAKSLTYFTGLLNAQLAAETGTPRPRIVRWSSSKGV